MALINTNQALFRQALAHVAASSILHVAELAGHVTSNYRLIWTLICARL